MADIEVIKVNAGTIDKANDVLFHIAEEVFAGKKDRDETTPEAKVLAEIGFLSAAIKICSKKLDGYISLLEDISAKEKIEEINNG